MKGMVHIEGQRRPARFEIHGGSGYVEIPDLSRKVFFIDAKVTVYRSALSIDCMKVIDPNALDRTYVHEPAWLITDVESEPDE
jgi:hypothetical protein